MPHNVKHMIRRGSSGGPVPSREVHLDNSDSDEESVGDHSTGGAVTVIPTQLQDTSVPSSTVADHAIEKLVIENNIFLKAALQLLDQRDRSVDLNAFKEGSSSDVIICGKLKKASSGTVSRVWKDKFVELRHGVLSYEDITGWGQRANRKTVQLIARQVVCRPSTKYHGHVFEIRDLDSEGRIVHHHSRKKLFMVESNAEMMRWIDAIKTAVIGSAGDFGPNLDPAIGSGEDSQTVRSDESDHMHNMHNNALEDWRPLHTSQMGGSSDSGDARPLSALPKIFSAGRKSKKGPATDGADGFQNEMRRFDYIKLIIHAATTPQMYRECLLDQALDNVITVPVAYMKKFLRASNMGNFTLQTTGSARNLELEKQEKLRVKKDKKKQGKKKSSRSVFSSNDKRKESDHNMHWNVTSRPTSMENSQAWKDLHRDTISINTDVVNGGVEGPEAMIGALVRHLLLSVQLMREKWVAYQLETRQPPPCSDPSSFPSQLQSEQEAAFERTRMLATTYADLDEGQALSIARDVLLSCNRTESGGDTYYCVQSLLCNNNFAVLTPHGCAVDPIEIVVDVVESQRKRSGRARPHDEDSLSNSISHSSVSRESKEHNTTNHYHHHQLSGICEVMTSPQGDKDEEDGFVVRDATTVESECSIEQPEPNISRPTGRHHYPDELLNAAAAHVKRGGRHVGDIDDYLDPCALMLQSDIPGASAIPSNMLLMREVSKRKKINQPGYIERSDSDNSIDLSMSEGDDSISSDVSEKGNHFDFVEKVQKAKNQLDYHGDNRGGRGGTLPQQQSYITPPPRATPVFQINCDDATVAMSELTMDSAPAKARKKSLTATLRKNLGLSTAGEVAVLVSEDSPTPQKKRNSFFTWSSTAKDVPGESGLHTPENRGAPTPSEVFTSPPGKSHLSWRSTAEDDASSVTDNRRSRRQEDEEELEEETAAQSMCIRVQVIVKSRYRLCNLDPQDEHEDTWANITGQFHQHFFLKSNSNGRPAVSDRFVTIKVDDPSLGH